MGGIGSATAYWMAREGVGRVLGLEQFELGHPRGESDDYSRIIRLSYHHPKYTALTPHAYAAWQTVEEASGEQLVIKTGGLDLDSNLVYLQDVAGAMDTAKIPYTWMQPEDVAKQWRQFRLPENIGCLYQESSGIVDARKALKTHVDLAKGLGATILPETRVEKVELHQGDNTVIRTSSGTFEAEKLVIAAGPWTQKLMRSLGIELDLTVQKEQVVYYEPKSPEMFSPDKFPIWLFHYGDSEHYYGFPVYGERGATKAGIHMGGQPVDPDTRNFDPDPRITQSLQQMLSQFMPDFLGPIRTEKTCLYTITHDRDFILDTLPGHPNVAVFVGAGHAYKFASIMGQILTQLVTKGATTLPIEAFSLTRPSLADPDYHRNNSYFG